MVATDDYNASQQAAASEKKKQSIPTVTTSRSI